LNFEKKKIFNFGFKGEKGFCGCVDGPNGFMNDFEKHAVKYSFCLKSYQMNSLVTTNNKNIKSGI
jgi:hypothetical protein